MQPRDARAVRADPQRRVRYFLANRVAQRAEHVVPQPPRRRLGEVAHARAGVRLQSPRVLHGRDQHRVPAEVREHSDFLSFRTGSPEVLTEHLRAVARAAETARVTSVLHDVLVFVVERLGGHRRALPQVILAPDAPLLVQGLEKHVPEVLGRAPQVDHLAPSQGLLGSAGVFAGAEDLPKQDALRVCARSIAVAGHALGVGVLVDELGVGVARHRARRLDGVQAGEAQEERDQQEPPRRARHGMTRIVQLAFLPRCVRRAFGRATRVHEVGKSGWYVYTFDVHAKRKCAPLIAPVSLETRTLASASPARARLPWRTRTAPPVRRA